MQPTAKIPPQEWMNAAPLQAVLAALAKRSIAARLVGGCVRHALLGWPVTDVDIAVAALPAAVVEALQQAGLKVVPTGIEHGTITAVSGGKGFEITSLRRDVETFGRHARVAFTDDWLQDAQRRDFTFNALFLDADGTLYDPFGGSVDLREGHVRFVGEAGARIAEDILRVFRFYRFFAWHGRPPADAEAVAACRDAATKLVALSAERVQKEILKTLAAPDPGPAVALMHDNGVLGHWLPEAKMQKRLAALIALERERGLPADPLRRLAALIGGDGVAVARRLKFSRAHAEALARLSADRADIFAGGDRAALRRIIYARGAGLPDNALLATADARARADRAGEASASALLAAAAQWQAPEFPLRGSDLLAQGMAAGPQVGQTLRAVEQWWIDGDFAADRTACLAELKRRMAGS